MGYRLHVHKKHVVEYGIDAFNWANTSINNLFSACCSTCFNGEWVESAEEWEVLRNDFKKLYSEILQGTDSEINERLVEEYEMNEEIVDNLQEIGFKYIADQCKAMDEDSEEEGDYIHFTWF